MDTFLFLLLLVLQVQAFPLRQIFKQGSAANSTLPLTVLSGSVALYILMTCGLHHYLARAFTKNLKWLGASMLILLAILSPTHLGLSLSWGILLLNIPVFLIIAFFECEKTVLLRIK